MFAFFSPAWCDSNVNLQVAFKVDRKMCSPEEATPYQEISRIQTTQTVTTGHG